ncbi:MAG: hypothetical protein KBG30_03000 [Bacteroidales bacterium]|nr:hypothetical protein [Bacteroidales bacterium]
MKSKNYIIIILSFLIFALNANIYNYQSIEIKTNQESGKNNVYFSNLEYFNFTFQKQNFKNHNFVNLKQVNVLFSNKITKPCLQIKSQIIPDNYLVLYKIFIYSKNIFKDYHQVFPFHYFY